MSREVYDGGEKCLQHGAARWNLPSVMTSAWLGAGMGGLCRAFTRDRGIRNVLWLSSDRALSFCCHSRWDRGIPCALQIKSSLVPIGEYVQCRINPTQGLT